MIKNWEVYKKQERDAAFFDGYKYEDEGCSIMKPADSVLMHSSDTEFAGTTAPQSRVSFFIYFACLP